MQFIVGIKIVSLISLIFGGALLTICGISLHEFLQAKFNLNPSSTPAPGSPSDLTIDARNDDAGSGGPRGRGQPPGQSVPSVKPFLLVGDTDKKVDVITDSISELKHHWKEFKPWLLGSSGVALVCGIVQVLTCMCVICAGAKVVRSRAKFWKCTHVLLFFVLLASLLAPMIFNLQNDSTKSLRALLTKIGASLKSKKEFDKFRVTLVELYSGMIALDIAAIVVLIVSTCCLMQNAEYDYRAA